MARGGCLITSLIALSPVALHAQSKPISAGPAVVFTASDPWFGGGGIQIVGRVGTQFDLSGLGALGRAGRRTVGRAEVALRLRLDPRPERPRPVWYVAGGAAGRFGPESDGFVLLAAGREWPAGRSGRWWVDLGVGGGLRIAAGIRWR